MSEMRREAQHVNVQQFRDIAMSERHLCTSTHEHEPQTTQLPDKNDKSAPLPLNAVRISAHSFATTARSSACNKRKSGRLGSLSDDDYSSFGGSDVTNQLPKFDTHRIQKDTRDSDYERKNENLRLTMQK